MTAFREIVFLPGGIALRAFQLLLLQGQLFLCIHAFRQKKGVKFTLLCILHLLVGSFLFLLLLDGGIAPSSAGGTRVFPPIILAAYALPWAFYAGAELASAGLIALCRHSCVVYNRSNLDNSSIKEAMDLLPSAIGFGTPEGVPVLVNLRLHEYCRVLTGRRLTDLRLFSRWLAEHGEMQNGQILILAPDGRALLFTETAETVDGRVYQQLQGVDVTDAYHITNQLQEKNARLRDIQLRIRSYQADMSDMVISREILSARTAVHDELGQVLLTGRYFFKHPERVDQSALYRMMQHANTYFLREAESPDRERNALLDAINMAGGIGVEVAIKGTPPAGSVERAILGQAIRECSTNAAKHAESDRLTVSIAPSTEGTEVSITNNGLPPRTPIQESGGLRSLRRAVEDAGGRMDVESCPAFRLTLLLPVSGNNPRTVPDKTSILGASALPKTVQNEDSHSLKSVL